MKFLACVPVNPGSFPLFPALPPLRFFHSALNSISDLCSLPNSSLISPPKFHPQKQIRPNDALHSPATFPHHLWPNWLQKTLGSRCPSWWELSTRSRVLKDPGLSAATKPCWDRGRNSLRLHHLPSMFSKPWESSFPKMVPVKYLWALPGEGKCQERSSTSALPQMLKSFSSHQKTEGNLPLELFHLLLRGFLH